VHLGHNSRFSKAASVLLVKVFYKELVVGR